MSKKAALFNAYRFGAIGGVILGAVIIPIINKLLKYLYDIVYSFSMSKLIEAENMPYKVKKFCSIAERAIYVMVFYIALPIFLGFQLGKVLGLFGLNLIIPKILYEMSV